MTYSSDMEEAIIASVIQDPALFPVVRDLIETSDFYWSPHRWIWTSFINLHDTGGHIDTLTVENELKSAGSLENFVSATFGIKGREGINRFRTLDVNTNHAETYAREIKNDSSRRKILEVMNKGQKWVSDGDQSIEILTELEAELSKIVTYTGAKSSSIVKASEAVYEARELTQSARKGGSREVKSGLVDLDNIIGGFFPDELIMVSARAGEGKTGLMLTMVANMAINSKHKKRVGIFSMEMPTSDLVNRLVSQYTGITVNQLRRGHIKDEELKDWEDALEKIAIAPIQFDDTPSLSIPEMRTKVRKMKEAGVDIIFIDQLNLMNAQLKYAKEFEKINWLSHRLKELAREFQIPIVIAHQMNRGIEHQAREPQLSDLEQAGEKPTDMVIMVRHKKENGIIIESYLHVVKYRNGATGKIPVKFIGHKVMFVNKSKDELEPSWAQEE